MKAFICVLALVVLSGVLCAAQGNAFIDAPNLGSPFSWAAGGVQTAKGQFHVHQLYPMNFNNSPADGFAAIHPPQKFLHFDLGSAGQLWILSNITYINFGSACFFVQHTYDQDLINYAWVRHTSTFHGYKGNPRAYSYTGLVAKAGSCSNRFAFNVILSAPDGNVNPGRLLQFTEAGALTVLPFFPILSQTGTLDFNEWSNSDFDPFGLYPVPPQCFNGQAYDFCATFYPVQDGLCLYPPKNTVSV